MANEPRKQEPDPAELPLGPAVPAIPDALLRPVDHPRAAEVLNKSTAGDRDGARQMSGWSISMNFAFAVMGMALLGWAIQKWVWPASAPWVLLAALAMGLVGGSIQFVRQALAANRG